MDSDTIKKWEKVKEALEEAGKTSSHFYKRAVIVLKTGKDPGPEEFFKNF